MNLHTVASSLLHQTARHLERLGPQGFGDAAGEGPTHLQLHIDPVHLVGSPALARDAIDAAAWELAKAIHRHGLHRFDAIPPPGRGVNTIAASNPATGLLIRLTVESEPHRRRLIAVDLVGTGSRERMRA